MSGEGSRVVGTVRVVGAVKAAVWVVEAGGGGAVRAVRARGGAGVGAQAGGGGEGGGGGQQC